METDILQYLPDWFRQIKDFRDLMETERGELDALAAAMEAVHRNFYLGTADAGTVSDWERFLHITPDEGVEPLDFRRARVINRLSSNPPFSLPFLYERLDLLIGKDKWSAAVDYENYTLYVEAAAENQAWSSEVLATINTIKPCHIAYIGRPLLRPVLALSETVGWKATVCNYRLGFWGLGRLPFAQTEDRGVIITPDQKSLQGQLMNDVASFTASDVASARLNGAVLITNFDEKNAVGDTAVIEYTVTPEQTGAITQIELLNADGLVLERAPVYVPVENPVQITHRIPVKEGN